MTTSTEPAGPGRFGASAPDPSSTRLDRAVPVAAAALVLVVLLASAAWFQGELGEAPDEVPTLVADGVLDDFTRAHAPAPLGDTRTGQPWEEVSGEWEVEDGVAHVVEPNPFGPRTLAVTDLGTSDGAVAVTAAAVADGVGVAFRYQDAFNFWFVTAAPAFGSWRVDRLEEGELVEVGGLGLVTTAPGTTIEVRFEGRTITAFVDGEQRFEALDPALEDATRVGLVLAGGQPRDAAWDDFVAVPILPDGSTTVDPS